MTFYPAGVCVTTNTERLAVNCNCSTYPENLGVCKTWERGGNGRCVYCDHEKDCHRDLLTLFKEASAIIHAHRVGSPPKILHMDDATARKLVAHKDSISPAKKSATDKRK